MSNKYKPKDDSQNELTIKELLDSLFPSSETKEEKKKNEDSSSNVKINISAFKKLKFLDGFNPKEYQAPKKLKIKK